MNVDQPTDVLADTDVLSFVLHQDPVREPRYLPHFRNHIVRVSFATVAEMRFGALKRGWGAKRRSQLEDFLSKYEVVETTPTIGRIWGVIRVDSMRAGRTIERQDAWIAATALALDIPLITHNAKHYSHLMGLKIITQAD
jgi:predicted nucleic acid-binding protein